MTDTEYKETLIRFAAAALQGLCANDKIVFGDHKCPEHPADCAVSISEAAFDIADAMMAELSDRVV